MYTISSGDKRGEEEALGRTGSQALSTRYSSYHFHGESRRKKTVNFSLPWQPGGAAPRPGPRQTGWNLAPHCGSLGGWCWDELWAKCEFLKEGRMFVALSEHDYFKAVAHVLTHSYPQIITFLDDTPQQGTNSPNSHLQMKNSSGKLEWTVTFGGGRCTLTGNPISNFSEHRMMPN